MVRLEPGKAEELRFRDRRGEPQDVARGPDTAAVPADIELDQHIDMGREFLRRRSELLDVVRVVDAGRDARAPRQRRHTVELPRPDDLVADQNVADAAVHHDLGFRDFLAADADGTRAYLQVGDCGALVGLGMRPQAQPGPGALISQSDH